MLITCHNCKQEQDITCFYKARLNRYAKYDGRDPRCKKCCAKRAVKYRATVSGKRAYLKARLKKDYGMSIEEFNNLQAQCNYKCLICLSPEGDSRSMLHIDHNHTTGSIRGLLCSQCNFMVGYWERFITDHNLRNNILKYLQDTDPTYTNKLLSIHKRYFNV